MLEVYFQINTHLQRHAAFCKIHLLARGIAAEGKAVIVGVCYVFTPKRDSQSLEVYVSMCTQQGINFLTEGVCLVPVNLTLHGGVGTDDNGFYTTGRESERPVGSST